MQSIKTLLATLTLATVAACNGSNNDQPHVVNPNAGGADNSCPNASNAFGYYPSNDICAYYKLMNFMVPYTGTMNMTAFYLDSGAKYPAGTHNGIDFQTSDVAGQRCQTTLRCTEHTVYAPIEGKVVAKNSTFGAIVLEFQKTTNGTTQTYNYGVLHLKPGSSDHLEIGRWIPLGKNIGVQWNTSSVNGTGNDFSAHVHLEFSIDGTERVLTQQPDSNSLNPSDFLTWINESIDKVNQKKGLMSVSQVLVSGVAVVGRNVVVRATGSNFPPSAFLGIWVPDTQDQAVATCDLNGYHRGVVDGVDYIEQTCTLNRQGEFEIFVKAKSGEVSKRTQAISVYSADSPQCPGTWNSRSYGTNQVETTLQACPQGQSGGITLSHTCQSSGAWGQTNSSSTCATTLLPPNSVIVTRGPGYIDVSWTASSGASGYDVWRELSPSSPVLYSRVSGISFRDTNVVSGNPYCYYISARRDFTGGSESTGHPAYDCIVAQ